MWGWIFITSILLRLRLEACFKFKNYPGLSTHRLVSFGTLLSSDCSISVCASVPISVSRLSLSLSVFVLVSQ